MALGPRVKGKKAVRRVPLNLKVPPALRKSMEKAADRSGRSLGAEVEFRVHEYEAMRQFVDNLLADSAILTLSVGLRTLRKGAIVPIMKSSLDESLPSLERAIATAACISNLFETVLDHAVNTLSEKTTAGITEARTQGREAGDLEEGFVSEGVVSVLSALIVSNARKCGEDLASSVAPTIGPYVWDICFDEDDKLRSTAPGMGYELMGTPFGSSVSLPPSFMPPLQTEANRLAVAKKFKKSRAVRDTAKHQMSEGQHPGMSEDEVVDMLYDDLLKSLGMNLTESPADATSNQT